MARQKSIYEFLKKETAKNSDRKPISKDGKEQNNIEIHGSFSNDVSGNTSSTVQSMSSSTGTQDANAISKTFEASITRLIISNTVSLQNPTTVRIFSERIFVDKIDYGYLLETYYDGELGKAVLVFFDPHTQKLLFWYDKTGHKPYFLTDLPPEKINKMPEIVRHQSFEGVEIIEKYDLLFNTKRRLTKIITKDPLAVRTLRTKTPIAWEADIKYHINYIYDRRLIPGMPYRVVNSSIEEISELSEETLRETILNNLDVAKQLSDIDIAIIFSRIFESKWFSPKRIALDIEVYTPYEGRVPSPESAEYPIMAIALASNDGIRKVFVLHRENIENTSELPQDVDIEIYDSEHAMIIDALRIVYQYPIVLTFNGDNFDLRYLYVRAQKLGIPKDFLGIEIRRVVKGNKIEYEATLRTSLHVDLYKFFSNKAIQVYAFEGRYKEVNLDSVSQALLNIGKIQLDRELGKVDLGTLVRYNFRDAHLTLELTLFSDELVWKLIILLMRISKLGLENLCRTTVSVWIKNLFYWEHRRRGYLIPRKEDIVRLKGKKITEATIKGKKYAGAIVIDPPQGLFFNVVVLDFASLYPSIMKRWNLSYETVDPDENSCNHIENILDERDNVVHKVCLDRPGITSEIVGLMRDFRVKIYKKKAKDKNIDPSLRNWYDVVQRAMKVYINAAYGVFGADTFPLYAPSVAESVTALGRRVITSTIKKARELNLRVLYGDTDSLFVWNPDPKSLEELKKWVEKEFGLELETDKTYKFVAFALKKNYVGVLPNNEVDIKGMVGKKRNTPEFIKMLFSEIVNQITSIEDPEEAFKVIDSVRNKLEEYYIMLKYKLLTLDDVAFHMALTKPLSEYKKTTPQHVKAGLMLQRYGVNITAGDIITFVKVKSKDGVKPIQLAKISEIDVQKYIEAMRSTLEQLFTALNISWDDVTGSSKL
ncbi:replicative DNA polymerase I [Ignisphaera aggregans DSM 17230]|uniref:DNA polymerase n=1 Tax=Ignisphaera aggregans (strain DSM 17230 / JCM 13409 / AQ1.S1) TaxID=583356 RepID=E0SP55_IGNAA|nr:replicative DNA polymerase I [Ignisphaera aggregans DSM 17230]